jgi:large repetitive protein
MTRAVRFRTASVAAAVLIVVVACRDSVVTPVGVDSVRISPDGATISIGGSTALSAAVLGSSGAPLTGRTVAWSSLDPGTATVDNGGRVSGVAPGAARIRASAESAADTVVVTVLERPTLVLAPATVEFTAAQGGASPGDRTATIGKSGDGPLDQLAVTVRYAAGQPTGWLGTVLTATTAPTTLTLSADHAGLTPGTYTAEVDVASPGAGNSPATLTARLVVQGPGPAIALSTYAAAFSGLRSGADPATQVIQLTNSGGGSLTGLGAAVGYADGEPTGWLSATLGSTAAPTSLTLHAATGTLSAGTYTATVQVASSVSGVHPVTVTVAFAVLAPAPTLALGTNSVSFAATRGGADPAQQNLPVTNSGGGSLTGLQASVTYAGGQPAGWLTASLNGSTAPATLSLRAATGALAAGTYAATVLVSSPDAANSPVPLAVTFTVADQAPAIALSPPTLAFSGLRGAASPAPQTVQITNGGGGTLSALQATVTYAGSQPTGWLSASLGSTTAPATLTVSATTGSLAAGTYTATVHVASAVASNSPRTITITFTVIEPDPSIGLDATTAGFSARRGRGNPAQQTIGITNSGGGSLTGLGASVSYPDGQPTGWLSAGVNPTTAPATLTLQASTGALPTGTHTATVLVTSPVADNSPRSVTVTFEVIEPDPSIGLAATSLGFNAVGGGVDPEPQAIAISNVGGGSLTGLDTSISYTGGQPTGWLAAAVNPTTAPSTLTLQASTGALPAGTYTATVQVASPVADNSPQAVSVTFSVAEPPPAIGLGATTAEFHATSGSGNPAQQGIAITNIGGGSLTGLGAAVSYTDGQPAGWLSATIDPTTAPATLTLQAATGALAAGTYTAVVHVTSSVAANSPRTVNIAFHVAEPPPAIGLGTSAIEFSGVEGRVDDPQEQTVAITNTGGGTLDGLVASITYTDGQPADWLTAGLSSATAPAMLTLQATTGTMPPGTYTAVVHISSPVASNSPRPLSVTFTVEPAPLVPAGR